jgi:hypothetical protein
MGTMKDHQHFGVTQMQAPKTMGELRSVLATIMAGAVEGKVKHEDGRLALNAATRIIESVQAETRARALAFAAKQVMARDMSLDGPIFDQQQAIENDSK